MPLKSVFTKGELLCHKSCQYQCANGLSIEQVLSQICCPLSHRGSIVLEAIVFSISRATLPLVQRRSHWADEGEVIKRGTYASTTQRALCACNDKFLQSLYIRDYGVSVVISCFL